VSSSGDTAIVWNVVVSGDRPFLSHLSRNESIMSSYHDPATVNTLAVPGIFLTDEDKDACRLVVRAQSAAGRKLNDKEMMWATGGLKYAPTCPRITAR
jgi:hypothetical protein